MLHEAAKQAEQSLLPGISAPWNLCRQTATTAGLSLGVVFCLMETLLILVAVANCCLITDKLRPQRGRGKLGLALADGTSFFYLVPLGRVKNKE